MNFTSNLTFICVHCSKCEHTANVLASKVSPTQLTNLPEMRTESFSFRQQLPRWQAALAKSFKSHSYCSHLRRFGPLSARNINSSFEQNGLRLQSLTLYITTFKDGTCSATGAISCHSRPFSGLALTNKSLRLLSGTLRLVAVHCQSTIKDRHVLLVTEGERRYRRVPFLHLRKRSRMRQSR